MIVFDADFTLLDIDEVAEHLNLTRHRVQTLIRAGELAAVHHGGRWMVALDEARDFQRRWTPPVRPTPVGRTRRFVPPPRPGDLPDAG